jgi:hypothetical protein
MRTIRGHALTFVRQLPTESVPEDLLLPFSTFVEKYELQAMIPRAFQVTGDGASAMDDLTVCLRCRAWGLH